MKTITNNIKCLNLNFVNGIANTFINCPFLVNELQVVGLSLSQPIINTNSQISYRTSNFSGSAVDMQNTFNGYIIGTQLTVSTPPTTPIQIGSILTGVGIAPNTTITTFLTGFGSIGTYTVSVAQTTVPETIMIPVSTNLLTVTNVSGTSIQVGMIISANGVVMNGSPIIISQVSGTTGGVGTYKLSTPVIIASSTTITGTIMNPIPLQEIQVVIYSTLLPSNDSPIGYCVDNLIGGTESSSTSANIIYHYPQAQPIMGNYQFSMKDYTGNLFTASLDAIVFIDFRLIH